VTSIGEIARYHIVPQVKPSADACELPSASALDNRMLAPPSDLACRVGTVVVFRREPVGGLERIAPVAVSNEDLMPCLYIRSTWCAYGCIDEGVLAALQVAGHSDNIAGAEALKLVTYTRIGIRIKSQSRDLPAPAA